MILAQLFGFSASILAFGIGFLMIIGSVMHGSSFVIYAIVSCIFWIFGILFFLRTQKLSFLERNSATQIFLRYDTIQQIAIFLIMLECFIMSCYRIFVEGFAVFE